MKKQIIFYYILLSSASLVKAQTWDSLEGGVIYHESCINVMGIYNGNLFAGGNFGMAGNVLASNVAQWNGISWDSAGMGVLPQPGTSSGVYAEVVYNGNLYVGGAFTNNGVYKNNIAQWNGIKWDSVGSGTGTLGYINALQVYNGNLFVGGVIDTAGGEPVSDIAQWNGVKWDSVSSGVSGFGYINALQVYEGNLYAGGVFDTIGHIAAKNIAKWNGTQWSAVSGGITGGVNSGVCSFCIYNGQLYAGGIFDSAGGQKANNIASWNGSTWSSVGPGIRPLNRNKGVFALAVYGSILCAGGIFDSVGNQPVNNIAYWNGSSWGALGSGITGRFNAIFSLCNYNGELIAGGMFNNADGIPVNNIAQWSSPLGINELTYKNVNVKVYPNPSNGQFTIQTSITSGQSSIEIYNILGEKVYSQFSTFNSPLSINLSAQPSGVYLYRIVSETGELIGQGKLIIQK